MEKWSGGTNARRVLRGRDMQPIVRFGSIFIHILRGRRESELFGYGNREGGRRGVGRETSVSKERGARFGHLWRESRERREKRNELAPSFLQPGRRSSEKELER